MSTTKQTRCPHCTSVFNITDDQLAARGGHVRCGSCLQVFRADQHLVDASQIVDIPAAPPQAAAPISTPPVAPKNTSDSQMSMPVVAKEQHAPPQPQPAPAKKRKKDDESWAMDLLGDLGAELEDDLANISPKKSASAPISEPEEKPQPSKTKKPLFDDEISDLLQEAWVEPTDSAPLKGLGGVDKIKESADESWAQALMSELEEEEKKEKAKNYSMELAPQRPKDPSAKTKTKEPVPEKTDTETSAKKSSNNSNEDDDLLSFLNKSASTAAQPQRINPTLPLEIKSQPMISINWGYWLTWSFMCIFATILLLVQYVYFHFNELAFDEKTRPQLVQICSTLGCQVPEPPNASLISIEKLVIRKHPEIKEALQINAVVFNKADFAQPLPALKLTLLNKKREVTAARAFQPKEYLHGDAAKILRRIPPETPIQIQLDIVNPKVDMTSYKMKPLYK